VLVVWPIIDALAQASIPADSLILLDEILVSAYREAKPASKTLEAISMIRKTDLQRAQLRTSPEALSIMPGVFVQKTNHGGGSPFIRGLTGNQALLLIDGIRLNNATFRYGPNQYFNTIDVFSLDRIEALRGGGAVPYGSDAMGGTIQAFSRELDFEQRATWAGKVTARWATQQMEQTIRPELVFKHKKVAISGGFTFRKFGDLVGGDTTGRQTPSGYREMNMDLKAKIALSANATITLLHQQVKQKEVPVFHKVVLENFAQNQMDPQQRSLSYARLDHKLNKGIWKDWSATVSLQQTEEARISKKNGSAILRSEVDQVKSLGGIVQVNNAIEKFWTIRSGIDGYWDQVGSARNDLDESSGISTSKRGLYPDNSSMSSLSLFSIHSFSLPKWELSVGARWNAYTLNVRDTDLGEVNLTPSAWVWNGSVGYLASKHSTIFTSVQTSFRTPNIDDLGTLGIVDFRFETPNYQLRPEKSTHYQVGYKWNSSAFQAALYLYRNELRNLITRAKQDTQTMQGYPLYKKENAGNAYIQGVEAEWKYLINRKLSLTGSFTYTYGQNISANEPVRRIPPAFGRLAFHIKPDFGHLTVEWLAANKQSRLAQGDKDDNRIPKGGTPGWNVLNFHFEQEWKRFLKVQLSMLNILNQDYRTHGSGINGYGRSIFVTLQLAFGK
jgi:outer membrane cobalamin receptor